MLTKTSIPQGIEGTTTTLRRMDDFVKSSDKHRIVKETAAFITQNIPMPDTIGRAQAIFYWVRDNLKYVPDINGVEEITTPWTILDNLRSGRLEHSADCDDHSILLAALLRAVGFETRFTAVASGKHGESIDHVRVDVLINGLFYPMEPTVKNAPFGRGIQSVSKPVFFNLAEGSISMGDIYGNTPPPSDGVGSKYVDPAIAAQKAADYAKYQAEQAARAAGQNVVAGAVATAERGALELILRKEYAGFLTWLEGKTLVPTYADLLVLRARVLKDSESATIVSNLHYAERQSAEFNYTKLAEFYNDFITQVKQAITEENRFQLSVESSYNFVLQPFKQMQNLFFQILERPFDKARSTGERPDYEAGNYMALGAEQELSEKYINDICSATGLTREAWSVLKVYYKSVYFSKRPFDLPKKLMDLCEFNVKQMEGLLRLEDMDAINGILKETFSRTILMMFYSFWIKEAITPTLDSLFSTRNSVLSQCSRIVAENSSAITSGQVNNESGITAATERINAALATAQSAGESLQADLDKFSTDWFKVFDSYAEPFYGLEAADINEILTASQDYFKSITDNRLEGLQIHFTNIGVVLNGLDAFAKRAG